jgi:hypothetical protein
MRTVLAHCSRVTAALVLAGVPAAWAEPMFLARQYARCTTCHHSPAGGGLLTTYGRALTHHELSTTGDRTAGDRGGESAGEEAFLWGALGNRLGPVQLGADLRPSHLTFAFDGTRTHRAFWMTAELQAAVQLQQWTVYGQIGRRPAAGGAELASTEYWVAHQSANGIGIRAGRFLPAYGIRFADHTSFNRELLGLAQFDQVYGVEVSRSTDRSLLQITAGPGRAETMLDADGDGAFTAAGRWQYDITPRIVVVGSALYREAHGLAPRTGIGGAAFGISPRPRWTIWTQFDVESREGLPTPRYVLVNETSFEAIRGVWLKISPQLRTGGGSSSPDLARLSLAAVLLPRTHWNVNVSYYRNRNRTLALTSSTALVQLHIYP